MKGWIVRISVGVLAAALLVAGSARAQEAARLKVLTFNVWGIIGSKATEFRAQAIGKKIAELDPDIIALEEVFESRDRDLLLKSLEAAGYEAAGWRYFRHYYGSGIFFVSKFPIADAYFEPYRVNCAWNNIERLGGKGIAYLRVRTPWGDLDFFHTHALSRSTPIFDSEGNFIPGDPVQLDRILQMYQIDKFVRAHKSPRARAIIAAGDFNVSPEMLEYKFLVRLTGFESSFDLLHPGENPSTFSKENGWVKDDFSRIDHIFFKSYEGSEGFWVKPVESRVEMKDKITDPKTGQEINYSDHYALYTEFEVVTAGTVAPSPVGVVPSNCPCDYCPLDGYTAGVLELAASDYSPWRNLALLILRDAYDQRDRQNPLILPMAEVIANAPDQAPVKIAIPPDAQAQLQEFIARPCPPPAPPPENPPPEPQPEEGDRG